MATTKDIAFLTNVATGTTPVPTVLNVKGYAVVAFQISGLNTGTVQYEASLALAPSTVSWVAVRAVDANSGSASSTASSDGIATLDCRGLLFVRARVTTLSIVNDGRLDVYGLAYGVA